MIKRKSISVWLILKDCENKCKVALQRRVKDSNHFPYVYQATWAGKIEEGETPEEAVKRECEEELGKQFSDNFDFSILNPIDEENFAEGKNEWISYNYFEKINSEILKIVDIHKEAFSEFTFIGKNEVFYPIESGKNPENNIVLFDDQYKVLKNIFNDNKEQNN
jgi:8-oxo-dGTP pyrophosphatase MutT (NUDIX family)